MAYFDEMIPSQITEAGFISPGPDESHKTHYGLCLNPVLRSDGGDEIVDKTDDTPYKNLDWDPNWLELLLGGHDLIGIMDTTEEHLGSDLDFLVSGLTMSDGDICGVRQCSDCKEDKPSVVMTAFNAIAEFIVFVLLVNIKSFCDFVYTSAAFAFNPITVLSVDILQNEDETNHNREYKHEWLYSFLLLKNNKMDHVEVLLQISQK